MNQISFEMDLVTAELFVTYRGEQVRFGMGYYKKSNLHGENARDKSPFFEFNEWLKTKPKLWQETIFDIYRSIRKTIDEQNDVEKLLSELNKHFIQLYSHVKLDEIRTWVQSPMTPVNVPIHPVSDYETMRKNPRETTYVYEDYLELVVYSLALRFIAPIWGDIHSRLVSQYGKDYKEIYSMELLHKTCLDDCAAERRLREFMNNTKVQIDTDTILMAGLSEEDFINYMLSAIALRRLALGDVSGSDNKYRLIAHVFYFFRSKIQQAAKSYGNHSDSVKFKRSPTGDKDSNSESNSQSVYDVGFSRNRISTDDKVFLEYAAKDHDRIISIVEPELDKDLYWESINAIRVNFNIDNLSNLREYMKPIQEVQLILVKWVLNEAINPVIYDHLDLETMIDLLGLTRAILWHRGYYEFATIVSAIALSPNGDDFFIAPNYRKNIDSKVATKLAEAYPLAGPSKSERRNMTALGCISLIEEGISAFNWYITLPEKWMAQGHVVHNNNRYVVQSDIRTKIGSLMLDIANQQKLENNAEF